MITVYYTEIPSRTLSGHEVVFTLVQHKDYSYSTTVSDDCYSELIRQADCIEVAEPTYPSYLIGKSLWESTLADNPACHHEYVCKHCNEEI